MGQSNSNSSLQEPPSFLSTPNENSNEENNIHLHSLPKPHSQPSKQKLSSQTFKELLGQLEQDIKGTEDTRDVDFLQELELDFKELTLFLEERKKSQKSQTQKSSFLKKTGKPEKAVINALIAKVRQMQEKFLSLKRI